QGRIRSTEQGPRGDDAEVRPAGRRPRRRWRRWRWASRSRYRQRHGPGRSGAKTGLMGGMWPGEQTMKAYNDSKVKMPKTIAEANALIAKAQALSTTLTKYNITLPVTPPTK